MRYALAFVLLAATPAAAREPIPLAEFEWSQAFDVTLPAPYSVYLERGGAATPLFTASHQVTVDQFPHTSMLDTDRVEAFDRVLAHHPTEGVFIRFWSGGFQGEHAVEPNKVGCATCIFSRLVGAERAVWLDRATAEGWEAQAFVPLMSGTNLYGYQITAIERTITADAQGFRLIGIAVPEPASWLLACLALCWIRRTKR